MNSTRKDLETIRRLGSVEHSTRMELLSRFTEALKGPDIHEQCWLTAGALLWAGVHLLNSHLGGMKFHAKGLLDISPQLLKETSDELRPMVPFVRSLQGQLPEEISKFDEVISYAGLHSRSWLEAAISQADMFTVPNLENNATIVERVFESFEYDPGYVGLKLEIEQKKFERIHFHSCYGMPDGNTFETTIGEALERLLRDDVTPLEQREQSQPTSKGTSQVSAERKRKEGTTEGTKTATSGDNADYFEKKAKRKFCDRCRRLKENWFSRIRREKRDIPLQTFLKEFFANPRKENIWNPVRKGKETPVTWLAMAKKFRDNEADWKPEHAALLEELRGTIGGH